MQVLVISELILAGTVLDSVVSEGGKWEGTQIFGERRVLPGGLISWGSRNSVVHLE